MRIEQRLDELGLTAVVNAFSEVVVDVLGETVGQHARPAIGAAALPLDLPVVVAAELAGPRVPHRDDRCPPRRTVDVVARIPRTDVPPA